MPDYPALGITQPNAMTNLGTLMGVAQGAQNLQLQQQQLQSGAMGLTKQRETLQPEIEKIKAEAERARIETTKAQLGYTAELGGKVHELIGGALMDKRLNSPDVNDRLGLLNEIKDRAKTKLGLTEAQATVHFMPFNMAAVHAPQTLAPMIKGAVLGNIQAAAQPGVAAGQYVTPPGGGPTQVAPYGAPSTPQSMPPQVPVTERQALKTDALGRPYTEEKDVATGAISAKPPPGSNYKPLLTLPPGETPQTAAPLLALRDQSQAAAAAVPAQHFNNRQILNLSDSAFTGTGSPELAKVLNAVGLQSISGDAGQKTSQLQHFIGLQIQQNAASMGANTDAARSLAAQAVLPGSSPAQAIKAITKVNDAYATGTDMFNRGMQAALNHPGNTKDVFAIRDFQNAWTANFDPRIMQLENAIKEGDKAEVATLKKQLGPEGVKRLLVKARNLNALVNTGYVSGP